MKNIPLVIAAHGTRIQEGVDAAHELVELVRSKLPGTRIEAGFVEITPPTIDEALVELLGATGEQDPRAVVVPLLLGDGGHYRRDIPEAIDEAIGQVPTAEVAYASYLGHDPRLVDVLVRRAQDALGSWKGDDVAVVVLGRGTLVPEANGDHCRLTRLVAEQIGERCEPAFIQVVQPDLTRALQQLFDSGARRIVVVPNFLFPGRLRNWMQEQTEAWARGKQVSVRCGDVIGACDELADVVIDRYRETALQYAAAEGSPAYLTGLILDGREVLVVGGGSTNTRRVPELLRAGASVTLVAPEVTPALAQLAVDGRITWHQRSWSLADLPTGENAPWLVLVATDSPEVNAAVAQCAESAHVFCVRADDRTVSSAWTPAVNRVGDYTMALLGSGTPKVTKRARRAMAKAVAHELVAVQREAQRDKKQSGNG